MNLPVVNFQIHTPCDDRTIADHIAHATSLGLPEADNAPLKTLTVVANGPSARDAPLDGDTLALNGALSLYLNTNRTPTYWAACDPQAMVADFLPKHPPRNITYLIASKCHPDVFARLKGCDVRLWHIDDHPIPDQRRAVQVASSVTLCIMPLMRRAFGYRAFEVYGWDACYEQTAPGLIRHHASESPWDSYPTDVLDIVVGATQTKKGFKGGRTFKTSRTWAAEAQDAMIQLKYADYKVNIHGDGLIRAIKEMR